MNHKPVVILEDSAFFKRGQLIEQYQESEDGIEINERLIPTGQYVVLNERMTAEDERRVREMIRQQMKLLFWNLYTKNSIVLGNG